MRKRLTNAKELKATEEVRGKPTQRVYVAKAACNTVSCTSQLKRDKLL
jgi:hypothetical protein